jgi:MFS family permease
MPPERLRAHLTLRAYMQTQRPADKGGSEGEAKWKVHLRALKYRNYKLFFIGQIFSLCGTWMQSITLSWLVYRLTGSTTMLGLIGFVSQVPFIPLSYVGGIVADHLSRRYIILITQTAAMLLALVTAVLLFTGHLQLWHIFSLAIALGLIDAFDIPARQTFLVDLVGKEDLLNAVALNSLLFNSTRIVGPTLAGLIVSAVGEGWCFIVNAASYGAVITALLLMKISPPSHTARNEASPRNFGEGISFACRAVPIRALLLLIATVSFFGLPYTALLPSLAVKALNGDSRTLGLLMSAAGVGGLAGAIILTTRRRMQETERWVALACVGLGAGLILLAFSRSLSLSVAILGLIGLSTMLQMTLSYTQIQTLTPDKLRGRVMAIFSAAFMGTVPFGVLLSGALAERFGTPLLIGYSGAICLFGGLLFSTRLKALRENALQLKVTLKAAEVTQHDVQAAEEV